MMFRYIREPANTSSHIIMPWPTTGTLPICEPLRDASCTVLPLNLLDQGDVFHYHPPSSSTHSCCSTAVNRELIVLVMQSLVT